MSKNSRERLNLAENLVYMADLLDRRAGICTGRAADGLRLYAQLYRQQADLLASTLVKPPQALAKSPSSAVVR